LQTFPKYASSKRGSFLALAISSSASSDTGENCPGFVPFVIAPLGITPLAANDFLYYDMSTK
ncbi:hypothetical protein, partial [Pseudomonas amygdali]